MFEVSAAPLALCPFALASGRRPFLVGSDHECGRLGFPLALDLDAREEGGQLVKLLPLPFVVRVIVAIRALDLDSQKDPRCLGGNFVSLAGVREHQRRFAVLGDFAGRRQQGGGDLVPSLVFADLLGHPLLEGPLHQAGPHIGGAEKDDVPPVTGPVVRVFFTGQQPVDDLQPLLGIRIEAEQRHFAGRRDRAREIEMDAAQKIFIRSARRRGGARLREISQDHAVDQRRHGRRILQIDERPGVMRCVALRGRRAFGFPFFRL